VPQLETQMGWHMFDHVTTRLQFAIK